MNVKRITLAGAALSLVIATSAWSQVATLVKDINTSVTQQTLETGGPFTMAVSGGKAFFWYSMEQSTGAELWTSDGTEAGTHIVVDLNPGATGSISSSALSNFAPIAGGVVFPATNSYNGVELWRSDGTIEGTYLITEPNPGRTASVVRNPVSIGDLAVYIGSSSTGTQIYVTDGTAAGTHPISATGFSPSAVYGDLVAVGDKAYVSVNMLSTGAELWVTDGTALGTHIVRDINPGAGSSTPLNLTRSGSRLFFTATTDGFSSPLWVTDGTAAGTTQVADLIPPGQRFQLRMLAGTPTGAFFSFGLVQGSFDKELWYTDGTPAGTHQVADILAGSGDSSAPSLGVYLNGLLYFTAYDNVSLTSRRIYRSDGTPGGTFALAPAPINFASPGFFAVGDKVVFQSPTATGVEPWITDGTVGGTTPLGDFSPGALSSLIGWNSCPAAALDSTTTLFPLAITVGGFQMPMLFRTDGTTAGTAPVLPIPAITNDGSFPKQLTDVNGRLFFTVVSTLYTSDGTSDGTIALRWFYEIQDLVSFHGLLYFSARESASSSFSLYKSDGTVAGTTLALPGATTGLYPTNLYPFGDSLLMFAQDPVAGYEACITDGTVAGTRVLSDIVPGPGNSGGGTYLATANGHAFFVVYTDGDGEEFYATDGTTAGTARLADINPGRGSARIFSTTRLYASAGNRFYFLALDSSNTRGLWVSDGTPAGTSMLAGNFWAEWLTSFNDRCYFFGINYDGTGRGIWSADESGASLVTAIPEDDSLYFVSCMTSAGNRLYYTTYRNGADTGAQKDIRLFSSDGTDAGIVEVGQILPFQFNPAPPLLLASVGPTGPAYVSAYTPEAGWELHRTNGDAGVLIPIEAVPGPGSSTPQSAILSGDHFYFVASSPATGRELWTVNASLLQFTPNCPADFDGDGTVDFFDYDAFVICFEGGDCPPGKTSDFDGDGSSDFFDYDAFVVAFELGC